MTCNRLGAGAAFVTCLFVVFRVFAHPLSPAALVFRERTAGHYEVSFRRSELSFEQLELALPVGCTRGASQTSRVRDQVEERFSLQCPLGLAGQPVRVLGLAELSLSAVVYAEFANGQRARGLLTAVQPSMVLPALSHPFSVFVDYLVLGVEHLLTGWDHLLFVLGLWFLARGAKALVLTLSAFTLGHSVTLCLAALGWVSVPSSPVELGIAMSLVGLALTLLSDPALQRIGSEMDGADAPARSSSRLRLPGLAGALGLLHGLGFAGALAETGLPEHQIIVSLLGFNLGVECAQLLVVVPLLGLRRVWPVLAHATIARGAAYIIGGLSACWCIERALLWIG